MITGPAWFGVKAAAEYHNDDDYHSGETLKDAPNAFLGKLAEELGMTNTPWTKEAYMDALRGTTESVEERVAMAMDGTRAACDFTASAPKSVSIAALVLGHDDVAIAHERAVTKVAGYLGDLAQYRVTEDGVTRTERAEGVVCSKFTHSTSRKRDPKKGAGPGGDPQLHSHLLYMNYVKCADGKIRSLENRQMMDAMKSAGAVYRAELAKELQLAGYKLVFTKDAFEISGISKEMIDHFSCGRKSIIEAANEAGLDFKSLSSKQRDLLNKSERDQKLTLDRAGLKGFWKDRAAAIGQPIDEIKLGKLSAHQIANPKRPISALEAVEIAMAMRTERSSTIRHDFDLIVDAIHASNYSLDIEEVRTALNQKRASGDLVVVEGRKMTTRERLADEKAVDTLYNTGVGSVSAMAAKEQAVDQLDKMEARMSKRAGTPVTLTAGQRHAVIEAALTQNRVLVWEGDAGVGKSTCFEAVLAIAQENGYKVRGLGPHGKAVDALKENGLEAWTSQKAFSSASWWTGVDSKTVIVIDEFGKVDAASARVILERAAKAGARVITSGDTKQWQAVAAGSPAHQLYTQAEKSGDLCVLTEMMRGKTKDAIKLHTMSRDDTAGAIVELFKQDRIRAFDNASQRHEYIGREFAKLDMKAQEKALVITGMNADRKAINAAVRKNLRLERGVEVTTFNAKPLEKAALRNFVNYEAGDVMKFGTNTGEMKKNETVRIISNDEGNLIVERKHGDRHAVKVSDVWERINLGSSETIQISRGELVQFTSSDADRGISTKDSGRVEALDLVTRQAKVRLLATDRLVTVQMHEFGTQIRYGYCQTSDGAQGATGRGKVWIHMASDDPTVNKNGAYTNITRMTDHAEVVTDMKEADRILSMQAKVSKSLAPDFADPTRKAAGAEVIKVDFKAGNRIWANVGAKHLQIGDKMKDAELMAALTGARKELGDKMHVTGTREFQLKVASLVARIDELGEVSFRSPKLNQALAESRHQVIASRHIEAAAEFQKQAVGAETVGIVQMPGHVVESHETQFEPLAAEVQHPVIAPLAKPVSEGGPELDSVQVQRSGSGMWSTPVAPAPAATSSPPPMPAGTPAAAPATGAKTSLPRPNFDGPGASRGPNSKGMLPGK